MPNNAYRFNPEILRACGDICPPSEALPVTQLVFRGIRAPPITANDFQSHVELGTGGDHATCTHWGLSVWTSEGAVQHARKVFRPLKKWHIASGIVTPDDGVLLASPTQSQPSHFTFWKVFGKDISGSFTIVIYPAN